MPKFISFLMVGGVGFIVDAGVLMGLIVLADVSRFLARPIAIAMAMLATWLLNRTLTFDASRHSIASEAARYGAISLAGAGVNYAVYAFVLLVWPRTPALLALIAGSSSALLFNYLGYSRLVFAGAGRFDDQEARAGSGKE